MLHTNAEVYSNCTMDTSIFRCNIRQSSFLLTSFLRCFIPFGTAPFLHVTVFEAHLRLLQLALTQTQI